MFPSSACLNLDLPYLFFNSLFAFDFNRLDVSHRIGEHLRRRVGRVERQFTRRHTPTTGWVPRKYLKKSRRVNRKRDFNFEPTLSWKQKTTGRKPSRPEDFWSGTRKKKDRKTSSAVRRKKNGGVKIKKNIYLPRGLLANYVHTQKKKGKLLWLDLGLPGNRTDFSLKNFSPLF